MNVEIFSICDAAADYGGRLNIMGTFEGLVAHRLPVTRESCSIALRLRFSAEEVGEHSVSVRITRADGSRIAPEMPARMKIGLPSGRTSGAFNLVLNVSRLNFPELGEYRIELWVNERQASVLPLWVVPPPKGKRRDTDLMEN